MAADATEQAAVDDAYASQLKTLYGTLFAALRDAQDPAAKQAGIDRFRTGVQLARNARDVAKVNFP